MLSKWKQVLIGDMKDFYQQFYDEFIPLFLAPTIEDLILANGFESIEEFMGYSFSFLIEGPTGKEEKRTYYYRNLIKSLDDFDTLEELESFLQKEYEGIRRGLLFGKMQWMMNHG